MLFIPSEYERIAFAQRSEPNTLGAYIAACHYDFEAMKPYLRKGSVLDIGCGLGSIAALAAGYCGGELHLLDGDGWGKRRVDYGPQMDPYNEREATEAVLKANGIGAFKWWDIGADYLPDVDNVISTISWGWHYPVQTYLDPVGAAVKEGGRLILDLRPGKGGEDLLWKYFKFVDSYIGFGKCNKTVWEKT